MTDDTVHRTPLDRLKYTDGIWGKMRLAGYDHDGDSIAFFWRTAQGEASSAELEAWTAMIAGRLLRCPLGAEGTFWARFRPISIPMSIGILVGSKLYAGAGRCHEIIQIADRGEILRKRIHLNQLRVGMFVEELEVANAPGRQVMASIAVKSVADVERLLLSNAMSLITDTQKGVDVARSPPSSSASVQQRFYDDLMSTFSIEKIAFARKAIDETTSHIRYVLSEARFQFNLQDGFGWRRGRTYHVRRSE